MNVRDFAMKVNACIVLILSAYSLAIAQSETFEAVESKKIPGILRTISEQTRANFEQIHTWQGELEFFQYSIDRGSAAKSTFEIMTDAVGSCPNEIAEFTENTIIFKCDLDKGLSYSKRSREAPSRYIDPATNKDLGTKSTPSSSSQIATKEYRYSEEPVAMRKGVIVERKAVKDRVDADCPSCKGQQPDYLPRYVLDIDSQVWQRYPEYANTIEKKGEYVVDGLALKVEERTLSGDVQYRVHEPLRLNTFDIKNFWIINTFSANAGYNIISSEKIRAGDGKLMEKQTMEYQKANGVYVPIRNTEDRYDFSRDFTLRSHEEIVLKNVRINDVIAAETFTYKNLGLANGDKFIDKIEGREYKYQDANLVPLAEPNK